MQPTEGSTAACARTASETTRASSETIAALKLLDSLNTGDIILSRTPTWGATFNRVVTQSKWSHVALVIRVEDPTSELWQFVASDYADSPASTPARGQLLILEAASHRGVSLFPLEARLARTERHMRRMAVRRLVGPPLDEVQLCFLVSFVKHSVGKGLETASMAMMQAAARKWVVWSALCGPPKEDWTHFFCSELVAEALQQASIIREIGLNSTDFLPSSFAGGKQHRAAILEKSLCDGYSYTPLEQLLGRHGRFRQFLKARKKALRKWAELSEALVESHRSETVGGAARSAE
jgi:hypothetical protein